MNKNVLICSFFTKLLSIVSVFGITVGLYMLGIISRKPSEYVLAYLVIYISLAIPVFLFFGIFCCRK